jgi:signal transduction histidine kinase
MAATPALPLPDRPPNEDRELAIREALAALRRSHEQLKTTQLQLIQSAKLESIGRLAAGIAHEVKNPLAIILAGVECLAQQPAFSNPEMEEVFLDIKRAVQRASSVIGGVLDFSASTDLTPGIVDLNQVVEEAVQLVRHASNRTHVTVRKELEPNLPRLNLDRTKIEQVLVNLFLNAIDAMPLGGDLTVRTFRKRLSQVSPDVGYRQTDKFRIGQSVVVAEIDDTGSGINDADLPKIFDPFFTTKPPGKGTGLGLAVTKVIISLHGGTIHISNRVEGGVRVTLMFHSITDVGGPNHVSQ